MAEQNFTDVSFADMNLNPAILRALEEMGFEKMTPIQVDAIPALIEGGDVIGQAQTGTGKTAAFGLPVLERIDAKDKNLQAIILCPTRELAVQAAGELQAFAKYMKGVKMVPVYGGQDIMRQISGLRGAQIVVGTPGRVMDHMRRGTIKMDNMKMVVLDEADEMLKMGFREDMEVILGAIEQPHQTCLFSATMPKAILDLTTDFQKDAKIIKIASKELTISNITQYYYPVKWEYKNLALLRLLDYYQYKRCVIFCNTKSMVDALVELLQKSGHMAAGLHGDMTQKQRDNVMGGFRSGRLPILIATDIAARGIDVDDVEAVFNYDIPQEAEHYVHRIGRTGRAGRRGTSHTLCRAREFRRIHDIEAVCHATMEERKIPTVEQIRSMREQAALGKVLETMMDGHSGDLIPVVRAYCMANDIEPEAFAAAALRMHMGQIKRDDDDIDVDLPAKGERRGRGDRRRRSFGEEMREKFGRRPRRFEAGEEGERREHRGPRRDGEEGERREYRGPRRAGEEGERREYRRPRRDGEEGERRDFKRPRRDGESTGKKRDRQISDEMKLAPAELKKRNKERSRNILGKVVKDLNMKGEPRVKKRREY